jgi:hypothetical protein
VQVLIHSVMKLYLRLATGGRTAIVWNEEIKVRNESGRCN